MLCLVRALTNGYHKEYQKKGSEFYYDAQVEGKKPVLGKWMELVEIVKKKSKPKSKPKAEDKKEVEKVEE